MKICIPVCSPEGLESTIEPHLPDAEHILIFDLMTREYEQISLGSQGPSSTASIRMDAVLCGSLNRMTLRALVEQGIKIYTVESITASQAIAQFENGELACVEVNAGGCGGQSGAHKHQGASCCGGHGHIKERGGCCGGERHEEDGSGCCGGEGHQDAEKSQGCGGHGHESEAHQCCGGEGGGCDGHAHSHDHEKGEGGCSHSQDRQQRETIHKPTGDVFKLAVCSQNRKTVTEHAGKCRKFWIYDIDAGRVVSKNLLELPIEQSFHETTHGQAHPLDDVAIVIGASMGEGLKKNLAQRGIQGVLSTETEPDQAVATLLSGWLAETA